MSIHGFREITCQKCGTKGKVELWKSINAQLDSDAKKQLIEGSLHRFQCAKCGFGGVIEIDTLYHDMRQNYVVQEFRPAAFDEPGFFEQFSEEGQLNSGIDDIPYQLPNMDRFRHPAYVFSLEELSLYVQFRDKLFANKRTKNTTA